MKSYAGGLVHYDAKRRRVWLGGQRMHHGLTGVVVTTVGLAGLAARRMTTLGGVEWALLGAVLMVHDWDDRTAWFQRGRQE